MATCIRPNNSNRYYYNPHKTQKKHYKTACNPHKTQKKHYKTACNPHILKSLAMQNIKEQSIYYVFLIKNLRPLRGNR
jgi:hypothetical protein